MSSVANKEEALKCLEIAGKALQAKDFAKAERFAQKAKKMCACVEVVQFFMKLRATTGSQSGATSGPSTSSAASTSEGLRNRSKGSDGADAQPKATKEQVELVQRIVKAKDFYDILGISKEASDDDIKRAYKKLALKLHPDKNKAPGAEEAFKAVSRAFSCLSDPEKRSTYDQYGHEDIQQAAAARGNHHGAQFYADELDPQEIFNMFFGGGFPMHPNHRVYRTYYHPRRQQGGEGGENGRQQQQSGWVGLLHLLPVLFLLLVSFSNGPQDPPYSMRRDSAYREEVLTQKFGVPFYVKSRSQFDRTYPKMGYERSAIEYEIDETYRRHLISQCQRERINQKRVSAFKNAAEAEKLEMKNCRLLQEIFGDKKGRVQSVS